MLTLSLFFVFLLSVVDSDSRLVHEWSFDNVDPLLDAATGAVRGALLGSAAVEGGLLRIRAPEDQFVVVGDARVPSDALGTTLMAWMALVDPFGNVSTAGLSAGASLWRLSSLDSAASDALGLMRLSGRTILYAASATRERSLLQLSDEPLSAAAPHLTHVAAVFDHFESTVALYVDGQLYKPVYGVEPTQTARFSAGAVLTIGGGERDGAALPLAFDVARVRFYDTALTAGEVQVAFLVRRCSNGRLDDGERGVDCGAPCGECSDRCANLVRDGDETDVDCGGLDCAKCAPVRDEQRAVLHQHAPTDVRYPAPKLTLGGNGGLSARVTASLIRARAEMVNVRVLAASGSSQSDSGGSCGGMQSAQRLLGDRGWLGNDAHFHTATNSDLCLHSWCDSNARASIAFDLGAVLHIDEMRVWNWNVANASELGAPDRRRAEQRQRRGLSSASLAPAFAAGAWFRRSRICAARAVCKGGCALRAPRQHDRLAQSGRRSTVQTAIHWPSGRTRTRGADESRRAWRVCGARRWQRRRERRCVAASVHGRRHGSTAILAAGDRHWRCGSVRGARRRRNGARPVCNVVVRRGQGDERSGADRFALVRPAQCERVHADGKWRRNVCVGGDQVAG
jgi:hypothetical protein